MIKNSDLEFNGQELADLIWNSMIKNWRGRRKHRRPCKSRHGFLGVMPARFHAQSSLIRTVEYDAVEKTLYVRFSSGRKYLYYPAFPSDFLTLFWAQASGQSVGKAFHRTLGQHAKRKLTRIDHNNFRKI